MVLYYCRLSTSIYNDVFLNVYHFYDHHIGFLEI